MSVKQQTVSLIREAYDFVGLAKDRRAVGVEGAGAAGGGCPTGLPPAARASLLGSYPQTNRGTVTPVLSPSDSKTGVNFHFDYVKMTVFGSQDRVVELVREYLVDRRIADAPMENRGRRGRFDPVLEFPGPLFVEVPLPEVVGRNENYCIVHLQGDGCDFYGSALLQGFWSALEASGLRWHVPRCDPCWDNVKFTPAELLAVVDAGNFKSRMFDHRSFRFIRSNSQTLDTLPGAWLNPATGLEEKIRHGQNFRLYNLHGFNRFEWQFTGDHATALIRDVLEVPLGDFSFIALGYVRKHIDFVDVSKSKRIDRCPPLPFWADFIGEAEKNTRPVTQKGPTKRELTAVQKMESFLSRSGRQLACIVEAMGVEYLKARIDRFALSLGPDDRQFIANLQAFVGSGLAGLPAELPAGVVLVPLARLPETVYDYLPRRPADDELPF